MLDFMIAAKKSKKKGVVEIYPKFLIKKSRDLMIRGGDFYAIWDEAGSTWRTDEQDAIRLIDAELDAYAECESGPDDGIVHVSHLWDAESGMIDVWHKYCQKQNRDSYVPLNERLIFSNMTPKREDYSSKTLPYPLEKAETPAYSKLMSVLYSESERRKIEWAIGSIVSGASKDLQKFLVLYGSAGTGKSTVLNIIQDLFDGYYAVFDSKALGSSSASFALEAFRSNPLVAIQHDGDLSKIEDNTRLNSLISHETMIVNEKFKSSYPMRFKAFLFIGTNRPVRITDAKSGILRRLIDVRPTGNRVGTAEYKDLMSRIPFELGGIAWHCKEVYEQNPDIYDDYVPLSMLEASNDFYNFIFDSYRDFLMDDGVTLERAWQMYKEYCDNANVKYPYPQRIFRDELRNYFEDYHDEYRTADGKRLRAYYKGFQASKFKSKSVEEEYDAPSIELKVGKSRFDEEYCAQPAQYANENGTPLRKWCDTKTTLGDLDTSRLHYVKPPVDHIVVDFDIPDENGEKCLEKNLEAAAKWPATYAEISQSGSGVHLHYIYTGDPTKLARVYSDHIEIKVFTGNSSLRRRLTECNDLPIAKINSGLPLKGEEKPMNTDRIQSERGLRTLIKRSLNREIHPNTKPSVDFVFKILEEAYADDTLTYDVSDMRNDILAFAMESTNQAKYCIGLVNKMHFRSKEAAESERFQSDSGSPLIFFDVEVFPNLFLVNWKAQGEDSTVVRMINPTPNEVEELMEHKLVGFNNRRYDNHILYGRLMGYDNEQLYELSKKIIGNRSGFFSEAYGISYTDVYDFCSKKQSLKKWEIELGIHHRELGLPWDEPVDEELWPKVAEYCDNDVLATEAVFEARKADFVAREVLADVAGMTVNDTTNSLTARIIFGRERNPQAKFNYRDMGAVPDDADSVALHGYAVFADLGNPEYTLFDTKNRPFFPGYKYENGVSMYRGEEVGEGGYVYSEPGMYTDVALLDISSMHPSSIIAENLFGDEYTKNFQEIRDARIAIKHKNFEKARTMLGGKLAKYLTDEDSAADLAFALKIAINSVYGLTSAKFQNPFKDPRNIDNIVAKRGALFMINLKHEVQDRGYTVAHIKTDSIKIPNADDEIIRFVTDYGEMYGYSFEHEATYERMCLVNDAVYIARHDWRWDATGKQFAVPYVFKTLFSKDPVVFDDLCETISVTKGALYLDMNEHLAAHPEMEELAALRKRDPDSLTKREAGVLHAHEGLSDERLADIIAEGHDYRFVGRVGRFCPMLPGSGGGVLYRVCDGRYFAAAGSKGHRWMEAEMVESLGLEDRIDRGYYNRLVDEAYESIGRFGDAEWFCNP